VTTTGRANSRNGSPRPTPRGAFPRAIAIAQIEFERGQPGDLGEARAALGRVTDAGELDRARFAFAFEEARRALIAGSDWQSILATAPGDRLPSGIRGIAALGFQRFVAAFPMIALLCIGLAFTLGLISVWVYPLRP
jgi:hypothetical protein